jgi:hypothetical protein
MASPTVNVTNLTAGNLQVQQHTGIQETLSTTSATYADALTYSHLIGLADGDKILFDVRLSNTLTNNLGQFRLIGVTSGTVIWESPIGSAVHEYMKADHVVKTTGVTEDVALQTRSTNGVSLKTHTQSDYLVAGDYTAVLMDGNTSLGLKSPVSIDTIKLTCVSRSSYTFGCPTVGYGASNESSVVKTFTPQQMYNELIFTLSSGSNQSYIMYTYTGSKVTFS